MYSLFIEKPSLESKYTPYSRFISNCNHFSIRNHNLSFHQTQISITQSDLKSGFSASPP